MKGIFAITVILPTLLMLFAGNVMSCDVNDLNELLGYTVIAVTNVDGTFDGADFGKLVKLDNGIVS